MYTKTRTLKGLTYPVYPFLKNTAGSQGEKTQNPNYRDKRD
jgi:hypothetical protein